MEITPLNNRVILEQEASLVTAKMLRAPGGLIEQPDSVKNIAITAKVVAVGPGQLLPNGVRKDMELAIGDRVLIMANHVEPFQIKGKEYLFCWDHSVQVVLVE